MDILYLLTVLWRKKWVILLLPVISVIGTYLLTSNIASDYRATSQLATGFTTDEGVSFTDERYNPRTADMKFSNLLSTMNSSILFNLVSYRLMLHDIDSSNTNFIRPDENTHPKDFSAVQIEQAQSIFEKKLLHQKPIVINEPNTPLLRDLLVAYGYTFPFVRNGFEINRVPNTDYIQVSFFSHDPHLSAFAVNAYCEEFLKYYAMTKLETSGESVAFFKNLVESKKSELEDKSEALKVFRSNSSFVNIESQSESQLNQIYGLEEQRDQINSNIYGLKLSLASLKEALNSYGSTDDSGSTAANQRVIDLKNKIDDINRRFIGSGSTDPDLLDSLNLLRQQQRMELSLLENKRNVAQTKGMSTSEIREAIRNTEIEIRVEESKVNQVNSKLYNTRGGLTGYASSKAMMTSLERDVNVASDEYLSAVEKLNEAQNRLMASAGSLRQTFQATPPASPEPSKRIMYLALAAVASLGIGVFTFIVIELLDTSLKTPDQFQRTVGLPLAGSLINVDVKRLNFSNLFAIKQKDHKLEVFKHYLRKIRYEIENSQGKIFLVTSLREQEGKTFVVFALAYVLALVKKKVLIIDTNFKNNDLTRWLATTQKQAKLLDQKLEYSSKEVSKLKVYQSDEHAQQVKDDIPEDEPDLILPTKYKNISIIGNGGGNASPEEIFNTRNFHAFIQGLSKKFDYILLEGAALNEYSDSKELVKYVDKIIPVFSAQSSIKQLDRESLDYLESQSEMLTGSILNNVDYRNLNI